MSWLNQLFAKLGQAFNWWFTISPWERGVRVRAGKHVRTMGPGIHMQLPFIDKVYIQNIRVRVAATTSQALTTKDGVTLTICAAIRFSIVDVEKLYQSLHQAGSTICQEVEGHLSDFVITNSSRTVTPQNLVEYVESKTDLEQYGLSLDRIFLTDFVNVKTYRLIQGGLDRYTNAAINTNVDRKGNGSSTYDY